MVRRQELGRIGRVSDHGVEIDHRVVRLAGADHSFTAFRVTSPAAEKYAAPSYGVSVAPMILRPAWCARSMSC